MSKGTINKVQIIGFLGKDPELKYSPSGVAVAKLKVATSDSYIEKTTSTKKERTDWHNVVVIGKMAEVIEKFLKKGSKAYFEGKIQYSKYTDKEGKEKYFTEILCSSFEFMSSKESSIEDGTNKENETTDKDLLFHDDELPF